MRKFPEIALWSFLLFALTAIVLPSCGVSRKGGSTGQETAADTTDMDAERRAIWEELAGEEYGPLPEGWDKPYQRRFRRQRTQADTTAVDYQWTVELTDSAALAPSAGSDSTITEIPATGITTGPDGGEETEADTGDDETEAEGEESDTEEQPGDLRKVDFTGDVARPLHITEDSTATYLVGNVVFYHNGTVITCDSAVRFSEKRMEFYKRVVINNKTTYVYGDRAEYNGEINLARVYSPMVKVVDEDAVLYTYNFSYNTYTEVGRYWGGGTLTHKDSQMESQRGYYNTEKREFTGAGEVELTNPDYKMISDSVRYNLDTEVAQFFVPSRIWNSKGEILIADRGRYRSATDDYEFTKNSYILTADQEMWADSMEHFSNLDYTVFRRDIQIIDEENNTIAFGDYGEYWGETEHGMLTLDPSLISFDTEEPDTVYMRSDSMFFYTYPYDQEFVMLHLGAPEPSASDFEERLERLELSGDGLDGAEGDPAGEGGEGEENGHDDKEGDPDAVDVSENPDDTGASDSPPGDDPSPDIPEPEAPLTKKQQRQARKAERKAAMEPEQPALEETANEVEDAVETDGESLSVDQETAIELTEEVTDDPDGENIEAEEEEKPEPYVSPYGELVETLHRLLAADSAQRAMGAEEFWLDIRDQIREDSMMMDYYLYAVEDALGSGEIDVQYMDVPAGGPEQIIQTVIAESDRVVASIPAVSQSAQTQESDSVQRVFYGYRNVRIFRDDFQAVCDSIVGFSRDSTLHMHIDPVMWSDQNQITSDIMIIYTLDEQLYKAEFYGNPFMASEVDSLENQYNQIKGKFMISWFRDNDIYKHDVQGNGQTYYYMEDDNTHEVQGFMVCESADITFYIDEQQIDEIIYRGEPDYIIYPIEMIPPDVDQILPGFKWEASRRPRTKEDVHTRPIRPRQREEVLAYPQPTFPLTESIEQRKAELTGQGIWRDRNDVLSPHALDFVRDVELKYAEQGMTQ